MARALVACCLLLGLAAAHAGVERSAILQRRGDASALRPHRSYSDDRTACLRAERQRQLQSLRGGGATISRLLPILLGKQQCRILMVGLDAAGKTTILYQLKLGEMTQTKPTLGFNVETVSYKNIEFMVWDMGGQDKIRQLWSHYYEGTQALIFVVDSADAERMDEARQELHKLMEQEELKDAVLLVYANKQDVAGALSVQQVAESLQLGDLPDSRVWYLQACAAASADGAGVTDGLDWLAGELAKRK